MPPPGQKPVARNRELREKLAQSIFEKVRREFSVDATVQTQVEIYQTNLRRSRRMARKKDGVLICGSYGNSNVGDETILESILQQLRARDADMPICVMSKTPGQTAKKMNVSSIYTFSHGKTNRRMKHAKLFISGGAIYYYNPDRSTNKWIFSRPVITVIGKHRFCS